MSSCVSLILDDGARACTRAQRVIYTPTCIDAPSLQMLTQLGEKMDKADVAEIFRQAEVDGFGQVEYGSVAAQMAAVAK